MSKRVGLHLRMHGSLVSVVQQAIVLSLPFFQSFLLLAEHKKAYMPSYTDIDTFRHMVDTHFTHAYLFAHGSFWLDLACTDAHNIRAIKREIALAKALGFTHMVMHTGRTAISHKQESIIAAARTINMLMRDEKDMVLVLENTAHGDHMIGSDIQDFAQLRTYLDVSECVQFCIDTAHAHAYGYQLTTQADIETFISYIDQQLGLTNIALLHLNDASDMHGSKRDRHALLGEGVLGAAGLHAIASHPQLAHIPIILELPAEDMHTMQRSLHLAQSWCNELA